MNNKIHCECKLKLQNKKKKSTEPKDMEIAEFEYDDEKAIWISKFNDGCWKNANMKFGKYKEKKLDYVYNDKNYCEWLKKTVDFTLSNIYRFTWIILHVKLLFINNISQIYYLWVMMFIQKIIKNQ